MSKNKLKSSDNNQSPIKTNDLLQLIIDNIGCLVFWKDKNSKFMGCNQAFANTINLAKPKDIVGKTDFDIMPDAKEAEKFIAVDKQVIKTNKAVSYKMMSYDKVNEWLDVTKFPLKDDCGKVIGIIGVIEDITKQVNMKQKLIVNGEKYRNLIESTKTAYVILNMSGCITETNDSFDKIILSASNDLIGKDFRCLVFSKDIKLFDETYERLLKGELISNMEIMLRNTHRNPITVTLSANILENGNRQIVCLLRDISKIKTAESRKYIQEQKQKDRLKQNIVSIRSIFKQIIE